MKIRTFALTLLVAGTLVFAGCGNDKLKEDVLPISDCMCRNIDIMSKLKKADPNDTAAVGSLQRKAKELQIEMTILYKEFNDKYKEKAKDEKFTKKFGMELRKAMLNCPSLSKEDREQFEKELDK